MNGVTATDASGYVTVSVSHLGRVDEIRLSSRWREKLDGEKLARALVEAWTAARAQHQAHRGPVGNDQPPAGLSADDCRRSLIETAERMHRDRLAREHDYEGQDIRRHVTVALTLDSDPTRLEIADEWLRTASTDRLTDAVLDAFSKAYEAADAALHSIADRAGEVASDG